MQPDLTPKQQTSEAIRQAETILITTGQHPSVDQVAAVLSLATILRKFGKRVSAIVSDALPQQMQFLDTTGIDRNLSGLRDFIIKVNLAKAEVESVRYEQNGGSLDIYLAPQKGGFAPSDVTYAYGNYHYDLVIVLGVPSRARIDRVLLENPAIFSNIPVINLDFHRSNESYGAVNLIEPTASSLCEILVATSESLQTGLIDAEIATVMLTGLMASTDRFTATHTTSKSLTVAAQMMAAGARQQDVVKGLYRDGARSDRPRNETPRTEARPQTQPARPEQQPMPVAPMPQPAIEERPEVQAEDVRPVVSDPDPLTDTADVPRMAEDPIIEHGHIELMIAESEPLPISDQMVVDMPQMADINAATQILHERTDVEPPQQA